MQNSQLAKKQNFNDYYLTSDFETHPCGLIVESRFIFDLLPTLTTTIIIPKNKITQLSRRVINGRPRRISKQQIHNVHLWELKSIGRFFSFFKVHFHFFPSFDNFSTIICLAKF